MGQIKLHICRYLPFQYPGFNLSGVHPAWEMHPSWINGIEALNAYNLWVSEVVLPIAFQWIEEHKEEVYADVADELKGDVGVAIAAAFEVVRKLPAYEHGAEEYKKYEKAVDEETWDPSKTNPVWTGIVEEVRTATEAAFSAQKGSLKETIR